MLLVGAGASFSTKDVEVGFYEAFEELGVEVHPYALDRRLEVTSKWLKYWWKYGLKSDPNKKPLWGDVVYRAGVEALEMALRFNVDWVFVISAMYLHPDILVMMRRAGLKVAILFTESPYEDLNQARVAPQAKVCFTNERKSVDYLRHVNPNTFYVGHSYSPKRHFPQVSENAHRCESVLEVEKELDVVFVGTGFQERVDLLKAVDWTGINLELYGMWQLLAPRDKLRKFIKGHAQTNEETIALYKRSKIGLNFHRQSQTFAVDAVRVSGAESLNPRAYELAACETFCLTDVRAEGTEIFAGAQPSFVGPEDLEKLIRHYLSDVDLRKELATEANVKVQEYTFLSRARQVLAHLSSADGTGG